MARARNIKPGFFLNEHLGLLSPHARLLFEGLWCLADRRGRLEDRPLKIKAEVFPFENVDVDSFLKELADSPGGFIIRYSLGEARYIQILNFLKHQKPHPKEKESVIPAYNPDLHSVNGESPDKHNLGPSQAQPRFDPGTTLDGSSREKDRTSPAESLILNPESLTPESVSENEKISTSVEEGYRYLLGSENPNLQNTGWVKGFLSTEFQTLEKTRPDLSVEDILMVWRDTVHTACSKGAYAPKWYQTTFDNKLKAYKPGNNGHGETRQSVMKFQEMRERLLSHPRIRRIHETDYIILTVEAMVKSGPEYDGLFFHKGIKCNVLDYEPVPGGEV